MMDIWRRLETQFSEYFQFPVALARLLLQERKAASIPRVERTDGLVVSLTTMPSRIERVHFCIRSLLAQSRLPEKIVLYLSTLELSCEAVPEPLNQLTNEQFEIRFINRDLKVYGKIVPALADFPRHKIVTCDDDKIYPIAWLASLAEANEKDPDAIICHFARELPMSVNGSCPLYRDWRIITEDCRSSAALPLGVGGVLYPPNSLHEDCTNEELFTELAPNADDLWLRFMSLRTNTDVHRIARYSSHPPSIPSPWNSRLSNGNVHRGNNVIVFNRLMETYKTELDCVRTHR